MTRPKILLITGMLALLAACTSKSTESHGVTTNASDTPVMTVYKSPTCGCCGAWVEHMREAGFTVKVVEEANVAPRKQALGVPARLGSCHTAIVDGYVIEGHVPAEDVRALLAERPAAKGLAVPGMPIGSPGMEVGDRRDPYQVLLFTETGSSTVFATHAGAH